MEIKNNITVLVFNIRHYGTSSQWNRGYLQRELIGIVIRNFFTDRIVNVCNSLPDKIVTATKTNVLKKRVDDFLCKKSFKVATVRNLLMTKYARAKFSCCNSTTTTTTKLSLLNNIDSKDKINAYF